jgi:hypothetical protein
MTLGYRTKDLPLFNQHEEPKPKLVLRTVPDIRFPAPSAPGSESSRDAAEAVDPFRRPDWIKILRCLANLPAGRVLSREEIAARTEIKECACCARISELVPYWVEVVKKSVIAKSKKPVDGYRLSSAGRKLFRNGEGE